jgi:hypothetical protein
MRLALLSIVAFAILPGLGCGRYRQHVYESRLPGHYAAYFRDRTQPPTADTLELNTNGTCLHSYLRPDGKERIEQSCVWTLTDKVDGSWLRFEGLSNGVHRHCAGDCAIEASAWDSEFVTGFDLPSSPDIFYAK